MSFAFGRRLAALGGGVAAAAAALQAERQPRTASAAAAPQRLWCWGRLVPSAGASAPPPADDDPAPRGPRLKERSPVDVSFWSAQGLRVEQISFGAAHAAALDNRGDVWAWGADGPAGGGTPTRLAPPPRGKYTSLASTDGSLYAVTSRGAVLRWAHLCDTYAPGSTPAPPPPPPAVLGGNLSGVVAGGISAGASHVLVRSTGGQLYAFGDNERGQLGLGAMPEELEGLHAEEARQVTSTRRYPTLPVPARNPLLRQRYYRRPTAHLPTESIGQHAKQAAAPLRAAVFPPAPASSRPPSPLVLTPCVVRPSAGDRFPPRYQGRSDRVRTRPFGRAVGRRHGLFLGRRSQSAAGGEGRLDQVSGFQ